jgi:hypothetical protein
MSRNPVAELEQVLRTRAFVSQRTRTFVSPLRSMGVRFITSVTLRLDQLNDKGSESGALLLKRMERKCGSARNVDMPVYGDLKLCPIMHIAAALGNQDQEERQEVDQTGVERFAEGCQRKPGQV